MSLPDLERFAYGFHRAELNANRKIWTLISNVSFSQPVTESGVHGTRPWPLLRTEGKQDLGDGSLTWTSEIERLAFVDSLGDGYLSKTWTLSWILRAKGRPNQKLVCYGCRVLDVPVAHEEGEEALGGEMPFSFMYYTLNGKRPFEDMNVPLV